MTRTRYFFVLVTIMFIASGCGLSGLRDKLPGGAGVNVPGKSEGTKSASLPTPDAARKMIIDQTTAQCKQNMAAMSAMPGAEGKNPEEVCNCVGNKLWDTQQNGNQPDPVLVQKEMMTCMGIDMEEMNRKVAEQRRMAEQMAEQGAAEFVPPETAGEPAGDTGEEGLPQTIEHDQPEEPRPEARRGVKYDPKTGKWTN